MLCSFDVYVDVREVGRGDERLMIEIQRSTGRGLFDPLPRMSSKEFGLFRLRQKGHETPSQNRRYSRHVRSPLVKHPRQLVTESP